jgi:hypothetical protein
MTTTEPFSSAPTSPVDKKQTTMGTIGGEETVAPQHKTGEVDKPQQHVKTQGITGGEPVASPTTATPATATADSPTATKEAHETAVKEE